MDEGPAQCPANPSVPVSFFYGSVTLLRRSAVTIAEVNSAGERAMNKVPVWQTVGQSFSFTFERYFSILGVVWLPLLILVACEYLVLVPLLRNLGAFAQFVATHPKAPPSPELLSQFQSRFSGLLNLLNYLVAAWMAVGVTKEALGVRPGPKFVYIAVGNAELLYLAGEIVAIALFVAAMLAIVVAALIVLAVGAALSYGGAFAALDPNTRLVLGVGAAVLFGVVIICGLIYASIRLLFLLAPATVAENRFGLWRSWELSRGNFWRLFAVGLLIALTFLIFEIIVISIIVVPAVIALMHSIPHMSADNIQVTIELGMRTLKPYLIAAGLIILAVMPIFYGMSYGAAAFAYRALVPGKVE
jgi:hypothetical protein